MRIPPREGIKEREIADVPLKGGNQLEASPPVPSQSQDKPPSASQSEAVLPVASQSEAVRPAASQSGAALPAASQSGAALPAASQSGAEPGVEYEYYYVDGEHHGENKFLHG